MADMLLSLAVNVDPLFTDGYARQDPPKNGGTADPFPRMIPDRLQDVVSNIKVAPEEQQFILQLNSDFGQSSRYLLLFVMCSSHLRSF